MATVKVRVSMFPNPIEVDEAEIPGLRQQGLLVDEREALQARRAALAAELAQVDAELKADDPPADPSTAVSKSAPKAKKES